jgi:hypothetical protein
MKARLTARTHLRNALSLTNSRITDLRTDPDVLKDVIAVRDQIQMAMELIDEVVAESKPATRAMRVFELL